MVDVGRRVVQQDRGAQPVRYGDECRDRVDIVGEGGRQFRDALTPEPRHGPQRRAPRRQAGQFPFGQGDVASGSCGARDELGKAAHLVVAVVDDVADAFGVHLGDAGKGSDEQIIERREVVGAQAGGDSGLLCDGAVADAGCAVALHNGKGGFDDLGAALLSPGLASVECVVVDHALSWASA